jgi:hypothetical protein
MIGRVLLVLGLLGTVGLIATGVFGYGLVGSSDTHVRLHLLLSLEATLVLLFSHTWIVLYLLATGRVITRAASGRADAADLLDRARRLRLRAIPWLLAALAAVGAAFLSGGTAYLGTFLKIVHHALYFVAVAAQIGALVVERRVLVEHDRVTADLLRRLQAHAAA